MAFAIVTVLVGVVVGGVLGVLSRDRPDAGPRPAMGAGPAGSAEPGSEPDDPGSTGPGWTPVAAGRCVPVAGAARSEPGPTGRCRRPVIDGGVVTLGDWRWTVGERSDLVILGHWAVSYTHLTLPTKRIV